MLFSALRVVEEMVAGNPSTVTVNSRLLGEQRV